MPLSFEACVAVGKSLATKSATMAPSGFFLSAACARRSESMYLFMYGSRTFPSIQSADSSSASTPARRRNVMMSVFTWSWRTLKPPPGRDA